MGIPTTACIRSRGLLNFNGTLYGTTDRGGAYRAPCYPGCGTVFCITTTGEERVLYSFAGMPDGMFPGPVINVSRRLYGTTASGGSGCGTSGCGTVFALTL